MKNVTLQLFEYLLAAENSNSAVNYNLTKYPAYWFLDEILSFDNVQIEKSGEGKLSITMNRPNLTEREIEVSILLSTILNLMQYNSTNSEQSLITKDELEKNLLLEAEAIKRKIEDENKDTIIINDWQQLLLGVGKAQIPMKVAIERKDRLKFFTEQVLKEYQAWKDDLEQSKIEYKQALKAQEFYDYILNFTNENNSKNRINLGIGILCVPATHSINHPILTLSIDVVVDQSKGICKLIFEEQSLKVDDTLDYLLFYDLESVNKMRQDINGIKLDPFDNNLIATVLQKIVKYLHPKGRYVASSTDAMSLPKDITQVFHRSVLYVREEESYGRDKLKLIVEHLSNNHTLSDVIGSIVDPNYSSHDNNLSEGLINDPLFVWSTDGVEKQMLNLLDQHNAVVVFEEEKENKNFIVANLVTHLMVGGKRVLIVGEEEDVLDRIQLAIPHYLSGLHNKLTTKQIDNKELKKDLVTLLAKKDHYRHSNLATEKVNNEIEQINAQLNEITRRIVDYRELESKKIFWKDKRYYPYELAQLISKLGGKDYLKGDSISLDTSFDMKDSEVQKFWELRSYFTPEHLSLLNYDFIDINELYSYHEYQKMLALEEKYLQLAKAGINKVSNNIFDKTSDIRFVQYLFDQLPKLMKDVAEIKTPYGKRIFEKALIDLESYHTLASSLDRINRGIKDLEIFEFSGLEREELIKKLNQIFDIQPVDLPNLDDNDQSELIEFYLKKRSEMSAALRTAHLILIFNEGAIALSRNFKGISAEAIDMMDILYNAAALHLNKIEFEICWTRVKSHFIRIYQPLIQQEHIHPACVDMYEALKSGNVNEFREVLEEIENLIKVRQNFVIFGNFISQIGDIMPIFTTSIMSDQSFDAAVVPNFKEAFDQGKLNGLFDQLHIYESEFLDQGIEYLKECLVKLHHEKIEKESWKNACSVSENILMETVELLEEEPLPTNKVVNNLLSVFSVIFMPLSENDIIKNFDPSLFDLVIFVDAQASNIMRITELMHAHKAILFGNKKDNLITPLNIRQEDFQKLVNIYGKALQNFGEQYFGESLFDLIADSAAWDAQIKLPKQATHIPINCIGQHVKSGVKKCDNPIEDEIFEALMKFGYDVKCKVKVGKITLDFLVAGDSNSLAINVVGDTQMQREEIKSQIEQEMELRRRGLNIRTVQASHFYLNSRKTLMDLRDSLEKLEIYPLKK